MLVPSGAMALTDLSTVPSTQFRAALLHAYDRARGNDCTCTALRIYINKGPYTRS